MFLTSIFTMSPTCSPLAPSSTIDKLCLNFFSCEQKLLGFVDSHVFYMFMKFYFMTFKDN